MKKRKHKYLLPLCVILLIAIVAMAVIAEKKANEEHIENAGTSEHAAKPLTELEYAGETAELREHVETVLLIGTDTVGEQPQYDDDDIVPYYNYEQADFLVLLALDSDAQRCGIIQINRDTMMDVPWLSATGDVGGTSYEQIALSHTYGSGREDSCVNTRNAVSQLLFNAPIDHYMAFTMDAVPIVNDLVGGVTVTVEDDLTPVDATLTQGSVVTLRGEQALHFVRARMTVGDGLNTSRMRRQRTYFAGFQKSAKEAFNSDSELAMKLVEKLSDYMISDMTADAIGKLAENLDKYEIGEVRYANGDNILGKRFYEFYVDEDDLWEIVKDELCE